ncbi:MAG: phosphoribosyltransferase family protein [Pigmentiphaga sp.]|uniref:ComF family protein n=1 Tax=Pigmentiphaga sp. TaxID=1977564 RepID=UPI0029A091CA|nr:phosphoribosyltransferase family protein [Pigmentiphaga sp.]MDX3907141.1 phosphoribosyltransferase family protein [Pigmentiphaga sp.]
MAAASLHDATARFFVPAPFLLPFPPLQQAIARLRAWIPSDCPLCSGRSRGGLLCAACETSVCQTARAPASLGMPWRCHRCALALPEHDTPCPDCADRRVGFERTIIAFDYAPPADALVLELKNGRRYGRADLLGNLLAESVRHHVLPLPPQTVLVPIPASEASLRRRGFNPAAEIARALGRDLALPLRHDILRRNREQAKQSGLDRAGRRQAAQNLYASSPRARGLHIGLVDDVMTTGSTLHAAAVALRAAGAASVVALAAARTPGRFPEAAPRGPWQGRRN